MSKPLVLDVVARKNSRDLELLALEFDKLAASVDGSNKSSQQATKFSKFLDEQISQTRKQVQQLGQDFERTGSADVFAQLRGADRNLRSLERIRKQVINFTQAEQESKQELTGLDAEVQRLSASYFELTRDGLAPARAEFDKLTDRQQTQAETVGILAQRYRDSGKALDELDLVNARRDLERLDQEVEDLGGSLLRLRGATPDRSTLTFGDFIRSETVKARTEVDRLKADLSKGGGVNIFGDLKKAEGDLKVLESVGKDIGVAVESGIADGSQQGVKFLGQAFGSLPPEVQAPLAGALVGAVVVALPTITSLVGAAFIGGAGLSVIGLGIVSQIKSPAVQGAFNDLKHTAVIGLQEAGGAFTPVLVAGLKEAESAFRDLLPEIHQNLDKLAVPAFHLFEGVIGFVRELGPGIDAITSAAAPFINVLAGELPQFGRALSIMLRDISAGAPGAILAFHDLFQIIDIGVIALGKFIEFGEKTFEVLSLIAAFRNGDLAEVSADLSAIRGQQAAATGSSDDMSAALKKLGINLDGVGGSAKNAADGVNKLNSEVSTLLGNELSAADAADQFQHDLNNLAAALDQNSRSLVGNSDSAIQNREAIRHLIEEAAQARDKQIEMAGGANASKAAIDAANSSYDAAIKKIEDVGAKAGLTKKDLDALAGQYTIEVVTAINAINNSGLAQNVGPHDPNRRRAGGGPVTAGQPYIVGENGPELFLSDQSGTIIPNDALKGLGGPPPRFKPSPAAAASQGSGGYLVVGPGGDTALAEMLHKLIDTGILQVRRSG